jgi:hypothetical protein
MAVIILKAEMGFDSDGKIVALRKNLCKSQRLPFNVWQLYPYLFVWHFIAGVIHTPK